MIIMGANKKESGIDWIGEIPINWSYCRFKDVVNLYVGNSIKDEDKDNYCDDEDARNYISSKDVDVIFNAINYDTGLYVKYDDLNFRVAPKYSTLMCIEGGSAGRKKAITLEDVSFVNKLCCFFPKNNDLNYKYLYYFLSSPNYEDYFFSQMTGMIGGVSISKLKNFPILLPPIKEQEDICKFLNKIIEPLDESIKELYSLIEKYKEYKQSLITEVITTGLDSNVILKDSGVELIGEIPNHWDIIRLKYAVVKKAQYGANCEPESDINKFDYRYVRITDIDDNASLKDEIVYLSKEDAEGFILNEGDVLFARSGATVGKSYLYDGIDGKCCFAGYLIRYVPNVNKLNPKFLLYFTFSKSYVEWIKIVSTQSTIQNVSASKYDNLILPLPDINEQNEIINYLDEKCDPINLLITEKEKRIDKLEEYKKSLIFEYVTGKKEVPK